MRTTPLTIALVASNVLAFLWELTTGSLDNSLVLLKDGALYGPLVVDAHQYWRIASAAFLHGGWAHIALNMFALYVVGRFVETVAGSVRMFFIYALAMIGSGIAVVLFSYTDLTLGASGAIFGLFGAIVAIGMKLGRPGRALIAQTAPIILLNLAFGFAIPNISNAAHIGGLISGYLAGLLIYWPPRRRPAPYVADTYHATDAEGASPE